MKSVAARATVAITLAALLAWALWQLGAAVCNERCGERRALMLVLLSLALPGAVSAAVMVWTAPVRLPRARRVTLGIAATLAVLEAGLLLIK